MAAYGTGTYGTGRYGIGPAPVRIPGRPVAGDRLGGAAVASSRPPSTVEASDR